MGNRPEQVIAPLVFAAGLLCNGAARIKGRGTVTWAAIAPDTEQLYSHIYHKASLTEDGASHPSGAVWTNVEVVVFPSWLDEHY